TLTFCGLRIGEALALRWSDLDLEAGCLRVRYQLDETTGERVEPKTRNAIRDVIVMPALAKMLKEHRLRSGFSKDADLIFANTVGNFQNRHNVRARILRPATKRAGLDVEDRPTLR